LDLTTSAAAFDCGVGVVVVGVVVVGVVVVGSTEGAGFLVTTCATGAVDLATATAAAALCDFFLKTSLL